MQLLHPMEGQHAGDRVGVDVGVAPDVEPLSETGLQEHADSTAELDDMESSASGERHMGAPGQDRAKRPWALHKGRGSGGHRQPGEGPRGATCDGLEDAQLGEHGEPLAMSGGAGCVSNIWHQVGGRVLCRGWGGGRAGQGTCNLVGVPQLPNDGAAQVP